jgi:hypothetical protein
MDPGYVKRDEKCVTIDEQFSLLKLVYKTQVHFMHVLIEGFHNIVNQKNPMDANKKAKI